MYAHRARMMAESGMQLLVHTNPDGLAQGVGSFTHGSNTPADEMKTHALMQEMYTNGLYLVFEGAQRPELWKLPNTSIAQDESVRVFVISILSAGIESDLTMLHVGISEILVVRRSEKVARLIDSDVPRSLLHGNK